MCSVTCLVTLSTPGGREHVHHNTEARCVSCYWMLHSIYLEKKWQFDMNFGPGCSLTFNSNSSHSAIFTWEVIHLIAKLKGGLF